MKLITKVCDSCGGSGYGYGEAGEPPEPVETLCKKCSGSGKLPHGQLSDDLIDMLGDMEDKVNDITDKCNDIWDALPEGWKN